MKKEQQQQQREEKQRMGTGSSVDGSSSSLSDPRQAASDSEGNAYDLPPVSSIAPPPRLEKGATLSKAATDGAGTSIVFCGNLSFRATEEDLFVAFSGYGVLIKCQIPMDGGGGSRGYGFVEFASERDAETAIDCLQGMSILGRDISLSKARPRSGFHSSGGSSSTSDGGGGGRYGRDGNNQNGNSNGRNGGNSGGGGRRGYYNS